MKNLQKLIYLTIIMFPIWETCAEELLSLPKDKEPFFVHRLIAAHGEKLEPSGFYCYLWEYENGASMVVFRVEKGKVTEFVNRGSAADDYLKRIRAISMESFDYEEEVLGAINKLKELHASKGENYLGPMFFDGGTYEIIYDLDGIKFSFKAHEPGIYLDELSEHNEHLRKLQDVYKELLLYYAQRRLYFQ